MYEARLEMLIDFAYHAHIKEIIGKGYLCKHTKINPHIHEYFALV